MIGPSTQHDPELQVREASLSSKIGSKNNSRPDVEVLKSVRTGARWSFRSRFLFVLVLMGVGFGIYAGIRRYNRPALTQYQTQPCRRGDLMMMVTATGTLDPTNVVDIGCEISGTVSRVEVDVNDSVRVGDLLFKLDTQELEAQVAKSRATLAVRQAELEHAEATLSENRQRFRRVKLMHARNVVTTEELDVASANLARAQASLSSSEAQVLVAQATLDGDLSKLHKSQVFSPIDGIVLTRNVEPGQTIAATFQTPVLLTICEDLSKMKLRVDVDEADVGEVREGQAATFTVDAYPNDTFPARISSLRFVSRRVQDVVTYEAVLEVVNEQLKLRPGMTAVADIVTTEVHDALLIPNAALRFSPTDQSLDSNVNEDERSASHVWVLEKNRPVAVPVTTGQTDGRYTEITSSRLQDGWEILVDIIPES